MQSNVVEAYLESEGYDKQTSRGLIVLVGVLG